MSILHLVQNYVVLMVLGEPKFGRLLAVFMKVGQLFLSHHSLIPSLSLSFIFQEPFQFSLSFILFFIYFSLIFIHLCYK